MSRKKTTPSNNCFGGETPPSECPVSAYAKAVVAGEVPACKWVKIACQRHIDDLDAGYLRGLKWDARAAGIAIDFFALLHHSKGARWGGKPFELQPWQRFIVGSLFGWKRPNGTRRYRTAYIEIPRKNGKTTLAAGIALYLLVADGEPGAEVYSAATMRAQAKLCHEEAKQMVKKSPSLRKCIKVYQNALIIHKSNSRYMPLGGDSDNLDGLNPSGLILDEVHAWKTRRLWDVLDSALGARSQPLTLAITTAGADLHNVGREQHDFSEQVLQSLVEHDAADAHFAYIATIDEGDDWKDESTWAKANPNLGVSVDLAELRGKFAKSFAMPSQQSSDKRYYLNVWSNSVDSWIDMDGWRECGRATFDLAELDGRECYGGLDLASSVDIAAFVLAFPHGKGVRLMPFFWVPKEANNDRERRLREILTPWIKAGFVEATEGDTIDLEVIEAKIEELSARYQIKEIAYDPWNCEATAQHLARKGIGCIKFAQNMGNFSEPSKRLEKYIADRALWHNNNPVLRWMASNTASVTNGAGHLMPSRKKSLNKIDGIPATCMAIGRMILAGDNGPSVYESRGIDTA